MQSEEVEIRAHMPAFRQSVSGHPGARQGPGAQKPEDQGLRAIVAEMDIGQLRHDSHSGYYMRQRRAIINAA
jgi:hypothetical protein